MKRETRFCVSADGTRIAYSLSGAGDGTPSVGVSSWVESVEHVLEIPYNRAWPEALGANALHVAYDRRGTGASQRTIGECSLRTNVEDLAAVADAAGLNVFDLLGYGADGSVVAAAYAAEHPARVDHLALGGLHASGAQLWGSDAESLINMIGGSWPLAVRTIGELMWPSASADVRRKRNRMLARDCAPAAAAAHVRFWSTYDIRALLQAIASPTLVTVESRSPRMRAEVREAASLIPGVRILDLVGGSEEEYVLDQLEQTLRFLRGGLELAQALPSGDRASTAIILFADIVDSTALTERMGDAAFRERARALDDAMRIIIRDNGGAAIDGFLSGDGVLATFPAASQAIDAALKCAAAGEAQSLPLHLGLHAGDVIREQNNVFGGAVNIAARISALSAPGEVLVSDIVRGLARTSASVTFEDRGEHALKGVGEPQRVYAVQASRARGAGGA